MKIVTSATVFGDAVGMRVSITYSEVDETGKIVSDGNRIDRVITDKDQLETAAKLLRDAHTYIE